jgi:hypothetical protein
MKKIKAAGFHLKQASPDSAVTGRPGRRVLLCTHVQFPATHHNNVNDMPAIEASGAAAALEPLVKPVELSFPLPKAPETKIHVHLTINATSIVLFLTTVYEGNIPIGAPLGSFVYALPDVSRAYSDVF